LRRSTVLTCFVEAEKYILDVAKRRGLNSALARSILKDVSGIVYFAVQ